MWQRPSTSTSTRRRSGGYTIIEIIIALASASTVAMLATSSYMFVTREWTGQGERLFTQQSMRSATDMLTRQLRLAGVCLPDAGPADGSIQALIGANTGTTDTITVRANVNCAIGTVKDPVDASSTEIKLDNAENFTAGTWAYILHQDTTTGQYFLVAGVNQSAKKLDIDPSTPLGGTFPKDSSVYGADSQTFSIDSSGAVPTLTVTPAVGSPEPAVAGIERLNIRYVLNRPANCDPEAGTCDVVDLPANSSEWAIVRTVEVDLGARSRKQVTGGGVNGFFQLSQVLRVKPRNTLF